jgi:hypothetical protein
MCPNPILAKFPHNLYLIICCINMKILLMQHPVFKQKLKGEQVENYQPCLLKSICQISKGFTACQGSVRAL